MSRAYEVNFDGLVGPTHNYAGLSFGNVASEVNKGNIAHPKQAALQGLKKMRFLHDLGIKQAVLPPLCRPYLPLLSRLGFHGNAKELLNSAAHEAPHLLPHIYSASSMWTANAATISPSADTHDGKLHITPANLCTNLHRSLEVTDTANLLKAIFRNPSFFSHHTPLPPQASLGDEGAANIMRFCETHADAGLEVLVYGEKTKKYPARQTKLASQAVFRNHGVLNNLTIEQHPDAIDAGVFHNDVIAVANENALLYHEMAFTDGEAAVDRMEEALGQSIIRIRIDAKDVTVDDAVRSYLFNSQLITLRDKTMAIIAPQESQENPNVHAALTRIEQANDNPVSKVHYLNLRESMKNGGGPACLRLRVVLTEEELAAMQQRVIFTPTLHEQLKYWVETHYRDTLAPDDLKDPKLMDEAFNAQIELLDILGLSEHYQPESLAWNLSYAAQFAG